MRIAERLTKRLSEVLPKVPDMAQFIRQMLVPGMGIAGQQRLGVARVLVVGVGGLGSPAALWLARAGVGTIGLMDHDTVSISNLHRQILYGPEDLGRLKVDVAREQILRSQPQCNVIVMAKKFEAQTEDLSWWDVVIDGTDSMEARITLSKACAISLVPMIHASIWRFESQAMVFYPPYGPCWSCLFGATERPAQNCNDAGVLGTVPGMLGLWQAQQAIKLLTSCEPVDFDVLHIWNTSNMSIQSIKTKRRAECPCCGALSADNTFCSTSTARVSTQQVEHLSPIAVSTLLRQQDVTVVDVRSPQEHDFSIAGSLNIPLADLSENIDSLRGTCASASKIVFVCSTGIRSSLAASWAQELGITKAASLHGGLAAWRSLNLPLTTN